MSPVAISTRRVVRPFPPSPSESALGVISLWDQPVTPDTPTTHQGPTQGATIAEAFLAFHNKNPHVYALLVKLARKARQRGWEHLGISMIWEMARWRLGPETADDAGQPPLKLNNSYRALYARRIMAQESDLAGIFETRVLHAVTPWVDRKAPDDD